MGRIKSSIAVADDLKSATIELVAEDDDGVKLSRDDLLGLIRQLGNAHAAMLGNEHPLIEGQSIEAAFNARWFVEPQMIGEAAALSFYHPSFGPLGFLVPMEQVESMASALANQVAEWKASRSKPS